SQHLNRVFNNIKLNSMIRQLLLLATSIALAIAFHQYRELKCTTPTNTVRGGPDRAECQLTLKEEELEPGRPVPKGLGCWKEDHEGEEREYCDLVCPKSHTVFISSITQGHRACFNFITYQIEKRGEEHYMWRSGKCANSTIDYRIGCKFDDPFDTQFKTDNEILAHLRARARRA
uniref:PRKCSH_1 domain-containing protein n=1 Tax=Haemonchus contortus TaxID=6289 RepID=A0A7I4Y8D3_HAECO